MWFICSQEPLRDFSILFRLLSPYQLRKFVNTQASVLAKYYVHRQMDCILGLWYSFYNQDRLLFMNYIPERDLRLAVDTISRMGVQLRRPMNVRKNLSIFIWKFRGIFKMIFNDCYSSKERSRSASNTIELRFPLTSFDKWTLQTQKLRCNERRCSTGYYQSGYRFFLLLSACGAA